MDSSSNEDEITDNGTINVRSDTVIRERNNNEIEMNTDNNTDESHDLLNKNFRTSNRKSRRRSNVVLKGAKKYSQMGKNKGKNPVLLKKEIRKKRNKD